MVEEGGEGGEEEGEGEEGLDSTGSRPMTGPKMTTVSTLTFHFVFIIIIQKLVLLRKTRECIVRGHLTVVSGWCCTKLTVLLCVHFFRDTGEYW